MPTTLSRIIASVRNRCGKVDAATVDDETILDVVYTIQTSMNNEQNLASTNRLVEKVEFQLTNQEMTLPVSDFDSAERVMVVADGGARFEPLAIVGLNEMPGMTDVSTGTVPSSVSAAAFVGDRVYFDGVPLNARVQLWYKPIYIEPQSLSDGARGVSEAYVPLLIERAAAYIRENFLNLPVTETMRMEIERFERQFKRHRTEGQESGLVQKQRFGRGRHSNIFPGPGVWGFRR